MRVFAPARLHMGFLDLSGARGRHFGSIGVTLQEHPTILSVSVSERCTVTGPSADRAETCLKQLCRALNVSNDVRVSIESAVPEHVGLGSGTQMSLAIGSALNAFYQLGLSVREIAALLDRGLRSGIGIGAFEQGGLIVDGGRGEQTSTPPLLVRMPVPDNWRFILVFDQRGQGLHGALEVQAFDQLPEFPQAEAERICYLLLMQALPAVAENDLKKFGEVISELQRTVGEHFAPAQGGVFASPEIGETMAWLSKQGAVAIGQTSWGPTGFCVIEDPVRADKLIQMAKKTFSHHAMLSFVSASARNRGGEIVVS